MKWTKQELELLERKREIINSGDLLKIKAELGYCSVTFYVKVLLGISRIKGYKLSTEIKEKAGIARLYMFDGNRKWAIISTSCGKEWKWTRKKLIELWELALYREIDMSEFITDDHELLINRS